MKRLFIGYSFLILSVLFLGSTGLYGQERLSLTDAIARGLENNFQIRIARLNTEMAENNNSWGAAGRYPSLSLNLDSANFYKDSPNNNDPTVRDRYRLHTLTPGISLNWVLFNGFSIKITKDKLIQLNKLSEGNAAIVVENTIQGIVLAYYKALLEKEKLSIVEEVRELSKDRYDYILSKKDVGAAATYDVLQAKIAWSNDTSNALLQEMNVKNALRNLNLILGEAAGVNFELTDKFTVGMHEYKLSELLEKLLGNNRTLKNQYINQMILKKDISLQRSGLYPVVSLNSGISRTGTRIKYDGVSASDSHAYDYYVNFSVSLNVFNGGNTRRAIANAKIQEKIGRLQIEEMELSLSNVLRTTHELYEVRKQLFVVAEDRIESARLNMEISTDKFKAGAINSFNYRDVQLLYLNAAVGKLEAIYNIIDTHSELMRLTGGVISEY